MTRLLTVTLLVLLTGCAGAGTDTVELTRADARATLEWVDRHEAAGLLTEQQATLARRCPAAVMAVSAYADDVDPEFHGVIYRATRKRFGLGPRKVLASCIELIPTEWIKLGIRILR